MLYAVVEGTGQMGEHVLSLTSSSAATHLGCQSGFSCSLHIANCKKIIGTCGTWFRHELVGRRWTFHVPTMLGSATSDNAEEVHASQAIGRICHSKQLLTAKSTTSSQYLHLSLTQHCVNTNLGHH